MKNCAFLLIAVLFLSLTSACARIKYPAQFPPAAQGSPMYIDRNGQVYRISRQKFDDLIYRQNQMVSLDARLIDLEARKKRAQEYNRDYFWGDFMRIPQNAVDTFSRNLDYKISRGIDNLFD
ncbi:MAG: hypothetical protein CR954_00025 [Candidatus Moraniibacteriota bacterium]|nr:MAG: hypothetical protein CR954_00025 [Candidatus Moranbacteria bacterium]